MLPTTIMSTLFLLDVKAYKLTKLDGLNIWVRWYKYEGPNVRWNNSRLDRVSFPPVAPEGAFVFVDPHYVLHACHIIPAFSNGKRYQDEVGVSRCAHDSQDWARCYVNR